jgi:Family of unknown function (DUF6263)
LEEFIVLRCRWLVVVPVLTFLVAGARAQTPVDLKWKFEKGKPFYQEMTTDTTQKMTVMGQNITQVQKVTFFLSWTPVDKDKDGNWTIKQKIDGLKMEIEIGGNKIPFDSTKDTGGTNPLSDFFKALVGSEFTLTIDKDMKITKIEGRDEFLKKLVKENQAMEPLLKTILSDEALKQMSDPAFAAIPDKPVKKGDTWDKKSSLNMGPIGSFETNYKYTYDGPDEKKLQKIKVDTTLKYVPPGPNAGGALPFKILKADLNSKESKGDILFDSEKGRVGGSNMTMKLAGTLTIEIGGMSSDVTLDQTQTTTVKTSDENPIAKKSS